ncbi:predicted protein [Naegleria gruberi]|uniref:RecQ-mediated genome instability protein 1 n=1 Tax=Naegleria gruberi TaxID=5762 RepID=D2V5U7_NAEGR|nr:uncharacterized protein NAEGRDRAFT_64208 [Naegleria gruberi]EFC47713.1 predicted protein [Naegleria gruberi]|eukprot:XP_002680457.1 predicted protein [Naegleria gruberi strain NEG-M]
MNANIKSHLNNLKINVLDDWVDQCVQFIGIEEPHLRSNINGMKEAVYQQFLCSDYDQCAMKPSPNFKLFSNIEEQHGQILNGPFVLQINDIWDIGIPTTEQIDMKELVPQNNEDVEEGEALFTDALQTEIVGSKGKRDYTNSSYSRRMLKFTLSDGHVNNIQAVEYKPLDSLSLKTPLGCKIKLTKVLVRRGILLLIPECISILGGSVEEMIEAKKVFKTNLAAKRSGKLDLKEKIEENIARHQNQQNVARNNTSVINQAPVSNVKQEEEELMMFDDDENIIEEYDEEESYNSDTKRTKR